MCDKIDEHMAWAVTSARVRALTRMTDGTTFLQIFPTKEDAVRHHESSEFRTNARLSLVPVTIVEHWEYAEEL